MMTTKQLAQHVCKSITLRDVSAVTLDVAQELLDALNLSLAEWLLMLPKDRRSRVHGSVIRGPVEQTISVVDGARGFAYLTVPPYPSGGYASEEDVIGSTVAISSNVYPNQLQSPGLFAEPVMGHTGTAQMTIFGDAIHLPTETWTVEGEVMLRNAHGNDMHILRHEERQDRRFSEHFSHGTPEQWWMESITPLVDGDACRSVLRVWPIPLPGFRLRIPISVYPQTFSMEDLFEARTLPMDTMQESLFKAIAKDNFLCTHAKAENVDIRGIEKNASNARTQLQRLQRPLHSQPGQVGTPHGY